MYPHITHTKHLLFFIALLHKAMISNGGSDKENLWLYCLVEWF